MFTPYLRVVPMHLAIITGASMGGGAGMLVGFTLLKAASDLALDAIDRRMAARAADRAVAGTAS